MKSKTEYGIQFVVDQDLPKDTFKRTRAAIGFNITCPFCGGKNKFNVNPKGFARCAKCGDGHDSSKGFDAIKLHSVLTGMNRKEAEQDLNKRWQGLPSDAQVKYLQPDIPEATEKIMPIELRNEFYKSYLKCLKLKKSHYQNLIDRGLSKEFIIKEGFKSLHDDKNTNELTNKIVDNLDATTKRYLKQDFNKLNVRYAVPGFSKLFTKNQNIVTYQNDGFLIPVRRITGEIEGFQIRHDDNVSKNEKFTRYSWLSSSFVEGGIGTKDLKNIHHTGFDTFIEKYGKHPETVYLTEGCLKADIASQLCGRPFIALMGVNNISQLADELQAQKNMGCKNICVAIDMDYRDKKEVNQALKKIMKIIREAGLHAILAEWCNEYKGIDDYLLAKNKKETNEKIQFKQIF